MSQRIQTPELDQDSLWEKIRSVAKRAGREIIKLVLVLYYCLLDDDTPAWARATIIGALVYFISPIDAVPDFLPAGYVDDLVVLVAAAGVVAVHIKPEHRLRAQEWVDSTFGPDESEENGNDRSEGSAN